MSNLADELSWVSGLSLAFAVIAGLGLPFLLIAMHQRRVLIPFAVLLMCLVPFGGGDADAASGGSAARQLGWGVIFVLALLVVIKERRFRGAMKWVPHSYAFLLLYALASVIWSDIAVVSGKRAIQLVGVLLIALAIVRSHGEDGSLGRFIWPGLMLLFVGAGAVSIPGLAFDTDGNYKGFAFTKNVWAQFALLMTLVSLRRLIGDARSRGGWLLFVAASASLVATHSATAITAYIASVAIVLIWVVSKRLGTRAVLGVVGLSIACIWILYLAMPTDSVLVVMLEATFGAFGKDLTLTGRTDLWEAMIGEIGQHPWFGTGYGGFWLGLEGPSSAVVRLFNWGPGQAHSGYIDVVNELGCVGLVLLSVAIAAHMRRIWIASRCLDEGFAIFHLLILVSALLLNIGETSLMRTASLWWIVLTISMLETYFAVSRRHPSSAMGRVRQVKKRSAREMPDRARCVEGAEWGRGSRV